jgi:hypothetical protein
MITIPEALHALRQSFPSWAFLHDPFAHQWIALRGRRTILTAATPKELADRVAYTQTRPTTPRSLK